jgi:hypothetical protein
LLNTVLSAHGYFTFPAPGTWPAEALRKFREATGERSLADVFIFDHGFSHAMYMEDAITALSLLPVPRSEWFTRLGYPSIIFEPSKLHLYSEILASHGYRVVVMEKSAQREPDDPSGKVVNIASARATVARRRRQWA